MSGRRQSKALSLVGHQDDAGDARDRRHDDHASLLADRSPVFWNLVGATLGPLLRDLETVFRGQRDRGKITFDWNPAWSSLLTISKRSHPFVSFLAAPYFSGATSHFPYTVFSQEPSTESKSSPLSITCPFDMDGDEIVMYLDGIPFANPERAAKFIIKKLFGLRPS
jgi:hypothetical protein